MTDEEFVAGWLDRPIGKDFRKKHRTWSGLIRKQLKEGSLSSCFDEGIPQCSCKGAKPGEGVLFYLSEDDFMQICPRCDSWTVFESKRKKQKRK